jgi:hypothetical protein
VGVFWREQQFKKGISIDTESSNGGILTMPKGKPLTDSACKNAKPKESAFRLGETGGPYLFVTPASGRSAYHYAPETKEEPA